MRVISGTARGHRLATFTGRDVRPTPDRVREAVFNMLASRLDSFDDCRVLDLFAGSGAMGIEALSRGAREALFIDNGATAARIVGKNLAHCRMSDRGRLLRADVVKSLGRLAGEKYDLIFMDPPYHSGLAERVLQQLAEADLLAEAGLIVVETDRKEPPTGAPLRLQRLLERRFGRVRIEFFTHED
ncbi:16S rRNA (guanine(966)-N(2))-methyltransferase RsmD [Geothermobacter ehrlichii]|uniref:16S rRNA (Guanine(966)-N(2))-methyltransferase RsmD n=1 Tax=Geothermobacter ehrlichii TaxID=213224 RepID=A0A5D3WP30_9BACT|nr:16S rRNA (guanine(966)-N(2))-methyltransferase RsmD [Geothermobacter ehrlichii]TYP00308.1 16S rRNA (guanine(966)-N(2))-methyltransferase RsmD [Geothermobacter ehrlichii]